MTRIRRSSPVRYSFSFAVSLLTLAATSCSEKAASPDVVSAVGDVNRYASSNGPAGTASVQSALTTATGVDCCCTQEGPSCGDAGCITCVCDKDPHCCGGQWDLTCVALAEGECAAKCECPATPSSPMCGSEPSNQCVDGDGSFCDDGDRCTAGDTCFGSACLGSGETDCDDDDDCTIDTCDVVLGCVHEADLGATCKQFMGTGACGTNQCVVATCAPGYRNKNNTQSDGCEYPCLGATGAAEACNDFDDDCDGQTDEGCTPTCAGAELANDGVDTDCDGWERFGPPNALKLGAAIPATGAASVAVSGKFHFGLLGLADVTGTLSRASTGAPVSWCVSGNVSVELPLLKLVGATASLCRNTAGVETGTLNGIGIAGGVPGTSVTGTFTTGAAPTLVVDVPSLVIAQNLTLTGATLSYDAEDALGEPFKVGVAGDFTAGPFTGRLTGDLSRDEPGGPLTGCLTASATGTALGLEFPVLVMTVCIKNEGGVAKVDVVDLHGRVAFESMTPAFRGEVTLGSAWNVHLMIAEVELVAGGLVSLTEAHLEFGKGETAIALTAGVKLAGVGGGLGLMVSGAYRKNSDLSLTFTVDPAKPWKPFSSIALTVGGISGRLQRISGIWKATLQGIATSATLSPGLSLTNAIVSTTITTNSAWTIRLATDATVGPFTTRLSGSLSRTGSGAPLIVSLRGTATGTVTGLGLTEIALEVKKTGSSPFTATLEAKAALEGQNTKVTGTLTLGTPWSLSLSVTRLALGPHFRIRKATLTTEKGGAFWTLDGRFSAGVGAQQLIADVKGAWSSSGNLGLSITMPEGKTWRPVAQVPFEVQTLSGQLLKLGGAWSMEVTATSMGDVSLDGQVTLTSASLFAKLSSGGAWSFTLAGTGEVGVFGTTTLTGTLTKVPGQPVTGCLSATVDQVLQGVPFTDVTVSACIVSEGCGDEATCLSVTATGTATIAGESFDITGTLAGQNLSRMTLTVADLDLAPGFEIDPATLTFTKDNLKLDGTLNVGTGAQKATLLVNGNWKIGANYNLDVTLAPDTVWKPIPGANFSLDTVTGKLNRQGSTTSLSFSASSPSFSPVAGLTIDDVTFTGSVDTTGKFEVSLAGTFDLAAGPLALELTVTATVDQSGKFTLTAALPTDFAPIPSLAENFTIDEGSAFIAVDVPDGVFSVGFGATASVCIFAPCTEQQDTEISVDGGAIFPGNAPGGPPQPTLPGGSGGDAVPGAASGAGFWLRGALQNTNLPFLGKLAGANIVLSSIEIPDFDLWKTPGNLIDDIDLPAGLSLFSLAETPFPIGDTRPVVLFGCTITTSSVKVAASIDGDWKLIRADQNFPGVKTLTLTSMAIEGELAGTSASVSLIAESEFVPRDNGTNPPLIGSAALALAVDPATVRLQMDMSLVGRWLDVVGLAGFAIQNPALKLDMLMSSTPPVVSAIGFNGDLFWRKGGGSWPSLAAWPIPPTIFDPTAPPPQPPSNIAQMGGTFFVDMAPTPSGLCLFGVCAPLPTFLFRVELANLSFPGDYINFHNALFVVLQGWLPGNLPTVSLPNIDTSPLSIGVKKLTVYASTHHLDLFGLEWKPGLLSQLIATIGTTDVSLLGFADSKGLFIEGAMEPVDILGLDVVELTGDPFRNYAKLNGGTISIPDRPRLDLPSGTVEGWVKVDTLAAGAFAHVVASKEDAVSGWALGIGKSGLATTKGALSMRFRGSGIERIWSSDAGVVSPGKWVHVAAVFDGGKAGLYVDGTKVAASVTGNNLPSPALNDAPLVIGKGCTAVDDIRLWTTARTPAELKANSRFLAWGYHEDSDLAARYEFDLDPGDDVAHNSRYYPTGSRIHGDYVGAAAAVLDPNDQDLRFKLALRVPGSTGSGDGPGLWMQAGARVDIPFIDTDIVGGVQVAIGGGEATGTLFVKDFKILPVGFGTFIAGGYGPNFAPGDFDDGLFATVDLLNASFAATGKLAFEKPSGNVQTLGGATVSFGCPTQNCTSVFQNVLEASGDIDLTTNLPAGLGDIGILGEFDAKLNSADWFIDVDGSLLLFGLELLSGSIELDRTQLRLTTTLDFGTLNIVGFKINLGGLVMDMELDFQTWEFCGTGKYTANPDENHSSPFQCGVSICIGGEGFPLTPSLGCNNFCLGSEFCAEDEMCVFAQCKPRLPDGQACGKNKHCISGNCGCITSDLLGVNVGACYSPGAKDLGETCKVDAECTVGRCSGEACFNGKCVCIIDEDCGTGFYCDQGDLGTIGANSCKPLKADGQTCNTSLRCDSGFCSTESPIDLCGRCYTPVSKAVNSDCYVNAECKSNRCGHVCGDPNPGRCKCENDKQCDTDEYCSFEVGGDNLCHPKKPNDTLCTDRRQCASGLCECGKCKPDNLANGAECISNDQCRSSRCSNITGCLTGTCVCDGDEDCASTHFCKNNFPGKNSCEPLATLCGSCNDTSQCGAGLSCISGSCIVAGSRGVDQSCCEDAQCTTNKCTDDVCGCTSDGQCTGGKYCKNNRCVILQEECDSGCGSGDVCESGYCTASFNGKCVTPNSLPLLATCCHHDQCIKGKCDADRCRCEVASDCSTGQYCNTSGDNHCLPKAGFGGSCNANDNCVSNYCSSGRCVASPKRSIGSFCYQNEDCTTGQCGNGNVCVCEVDSHCASDEYCAEPIGQAAYCADKRTIGSNCDQDAKCLSGCCKGIIGFQECKAASSCN